MAEFDSLVDDSQAAAPAQQAPAAPTAPLQGVSFDQLQDDEQTHSTPLEMAKTAAEGAAQGIAGPLAPYLETKLGIAEPQDILAREKANPITHGVGEAAGLVGSMFTPIPGLGAGVEAAGHAAQVALKLAEPATFGAKVGSAAVKAAAEMAVMQGSDEASKMVLHDPDTSAESAVANIGLAAALGGAGGAFIRGAVSPLWEATAQPQLEKALNVLKNHWNGVNNSIPEGVKAAEQALGVNMPNEMKAAISSPNLGQTYKELKEAGNEIVLQNEKALNLNIENAVMNSIGKSPEEFVNYDAAEAGRDAMNTFKQELKARVEPIAQKFNELTEPFKNAVVSPARKANLGDAITQMAMDKGWNAADTPQNEIVTAAMNRLPNINTAEDVKKAITQIGNIAQKDPQALSAPAREVINAMMDAQHNVLGDAISETAPQLMEKYIQARAEWAAISKVGRQVGGELGLGRYSGPEALLKALEEKRSPEQFLSRLSPSGNAEILPFMQEHFPQTLEHIRDNELKKIIAPAIKSAKGDSVINLKTLQNKIDTLKAGKQSLVNFAMPPELINKIEAAHTLQQAIPSSASQYGNKEIGNLPASALAGISYITGHGPFAGLVAAPIIKILRSDMPQAVKLGMLRFAAADQPVKASAFKASVEYMTNALKQQKLMQSATKSVFTTGKAVATNLMPNTADREKLDKQITLSQNNPQQLMGITNGQVGHYMPEHQTGLTTAVTRQVQYLQQLKPQPFQASPLDRKIEPAPAAIARYNRALDIANQPAIVLEHVRSGTLQQSDIQDLNAMYPGLYQQMSKQLSNEMVNAQHDGQAIPYKTKIGLSLFLGQPLDSSMSPQSIIAAQPMPQQPPQQQQKGSTNGRPSKMTQKSTNLYQTPGQNAEKDRSSRD